MSDSKIKFVCMAHQGCGFEITLSKYGARDAPRCPNCRIKKGEQKGLPTVLVRKDIPMVEEDFL